MSEQTNLQPDAETQELFKKALQKNKQEREAEEARRNAQGNFTGFEEIEWCGLESKKDMVGRIIGNPIEMRKNATDPKVVYYSKFVNDKGTGYIEVKWKTKEDGELDDSWILKELYDAVMKKEWVKYPDGHKNDKGYDGEYKYTNEGKSSFIRLSNNQKKDSANQYPPKSNPKKRLVLNWLDRMDNWCSENKHFKLLSSRKNFWKNDDNNKPIYFCDFGVPEMIYPLVMDNVVTWRNTWDLDIVLHKTGNMNDAYHVKDILEEKLSEETKAKGTIDPLTEEEKQYEAYDIDKLTKPCSYQKMLRNLIGLFTYADADTGMKYNFVDRLKKLAEEEAKEYANQQKKEDNKAVEQWDEQSAEQKIVEVDTSAPVEEVKEETQTRRSVVEVIENATTSIEDQCVANFSKWNELPDQEKKEFCNLIDHFEEKVPIYKDPKSALPCPNKDCKFADSDVRTTFPDTIFNCPVCGIKDESGNN